MKVTEIIDKSQNPFITYEIIPPKRGSSVKQLLNLVEALMPFEPPFIDVTSHAAEIYYEEFQDGVVKRHVKRKRPGTVGVCAVIKAKYNIETVPHILCEGFSREETEDLLIELNYLGIQNVLALRGDNHGNLKPIATNKTKNGYAVDLVQQIKEMNRGAYLENLLDATPTDFCIGVAGYPEKHIEAPNITKDLAYLKAKVDAGADYIVTQMFFDNTHFFRFVDQCRAAGITVPIIPGLKVMTAKKQLASLPKFFFLDIPEALANEVEASKTENVAHIGMEWAKKQSEELMSAGFNVHFYIMQNAKHIVPVVKALRKMG